MQDTATVICPYCGERNEIFLDFSGGKSQHYQEECQVCCRAWEVYVEFRAGRPDIKVLPDNA
jgi:sarcosine oxidase delta subunit